MIHIQGRVLFRLKLRHSREFTFFLFQERPFDARLATRRGRLNELAANWFFARSSPLWQPRDRLFWPCSCLNLRHNQKHAKDHLNHLWHLDEAHGRVSRGDLRCKNELRLCERFRVAIEVWRGLVGGFKLICEVLVEGFWEESWRISRVSSVIKLYCLNTQNL